MGAMATGWGTTTIAHGVHRGVSGRGAGASGGGVTRRGAGWGRLGAAGGGGAGRIGVPYEYSSAAPGVWRWVRPVIGRRGVGSAVGAGRGPHGRAWAWSDWSVIS